MKYITIFFVFVLMLVAVVYVALFTSAGNDIAKPFLEKEIAIVTKVDAKLEIFRLGFSTASIVLVLNKNNTIRLKANYSLLAKSFNSVYRINFQDLSKLQALTQKPLRGTLKTEGSVIGKIDKFRVKGTSSIASSDTHYDIVVSKLALTSIKAKISSLQIQKALYALQLAPYSDGLLDMQIDIKNANIGRLDGLVKTEISHGKLNTNYLTKEMQFSSVMPKTTYSLNVITKLKGANAISAVNLYSNLLELHTKETKFNLTDKSLKSDYSLNIKNLDKLYFVTERHLKGAVLARGDISKAKDLDVSIYSDIADGKLSITLHNDDLKAKLKGAKTLEILDMTLYPKLFDARINADVAYNLAVKKGTIDAKLLSGTFTKNQPLDLVKKYGKVDMYVEKFDGDLKAKIEQEKLIGSLFLKSNHSSIETKNAILNTKRKTVNSKIDINANGNQVKVTLKGDINHPKVSINADALLKRKAAKLINKFLNKFY